jgi:hypothetical protein
MLLKLAVGVLVLISSTRSRIASAKTLSTSNGHCHPVPRLDGKRDNESP